MFSTSFNYHVFASEQPDAAFDQPNASRIVRALNKMKRDTLTKKLAALHAQQAALMEVRQDYLDMGDFLGRSDRLQEITLIYVDVTEEINSLFIALCKL